MVVAALTAVAKTVVHVGRKTSQTFVAFRPRGGYVLHGLRTMHDVVDLGLHHTKNVHDRLDDVRTGIFGPLFGGIHEKRR